MMLPPGFPKKSPPRGLVYWLGSRIWASVSFQNFANGQRKMSYVWREIVRLGECAGEYVQGGNVLHPVTEA